MDCSWFRTFLICALTLSQKGSKSQLYCSRSLPSRSSSEKVSNSEFPGQVCSETVSTASYQPSSALAGEGV